MPGKILVGTASWTDKSLIEAGTFYPPDVTTPEERLRFYASQFPIVEVDSSYYALPSSRNSALWVERTPPGFVFDVKAFRLFTRHQTPPSALPRDIQRAMPPLPDNKRNLYYQDVPPELRTELWRRFKEALEPLAFAGKLGVVLFQFPPWFTPTPQNFDHILHCADAMEGFQLAVEFRNRAWLAPRREREALAFLRENGLAFVIVDEPQGFSSSVPAVWEVTSPQAAIVRLHGRNSETWAKKGLASSAERFNYLYSTDELAELAPSVRSLAEQAGEVHAIFNNNFRDYAQRNAKQMAELL